MEQVISVREFLRINGRDSFLDTEPLFSGLRKLVDKIPYKDLRMIQMLLSNFPTTYITLYIPLTPHQ
ncbi:hypothetical protein [Metabacillus litoralis]|uniref:hypothetical protein n=1 Tax=Metabacillus litoralis TaxID=152268 RepID=UPI00203F3368|nr:hypothetical protein [Metabacillus litoralis]MCM3409531.1 hypothetical protein [Metabacillus litoralis]